MPTFKKMNSSFCQMNLCHNITFINRRLLIFISGAEIRLSQALQSVVGEKTGDLQGLTAMQIPNQTPWDSHHGPRPGSSSSLNTQFVHYNKATTYLNRSRMSSPTWSPLSAPTHPKLDALGQQSSGNTMCALRARGVSSLPSHLRLLPGPRTQPQPSPRLLHHRSTPQSQNHGKRAWRGR